MSNRITIKDVAREAGVSVATVSYVVNNRTDVQITEATRKKVLQITNLLGYTPNKAAQAHDSSRKRMLALNFPHSASVLQMAEQMYVTRFLSSFLHGKNYGLTYLDDSYTERYDLADAIICYDVSSEYFYQIGDRNYVPLLAMDCRLSDNWLFFQVNSDYEKMAAAARDYFCGSDYTLLVLDTENCEKKELFSSVFPSVAYILDYPELAAYTEQNILVVNHVLFESLRPLMASDAMLFYQPLATTEKAEALCQCVEYALDRAPSVPHDVKI